MSSVMNIRIQDKTLEQTDRLKEIFDAPSRSDVIRRAIELSDALTDAVKRGEKIFVEGHGERRQIIIPGVKKHDR